MLNNNNINEIWKNVIGFENRYMISNHGNVKSLQDNHGNKRIQKLKIFIRSDTCQYLYARLSYKGKTFNQAVHRMLALAFIPNPQNKPTVNHEDGIKLNNFDWNLTWMTYSEQLEHAYKLGLHVPTRQGLGKKWGKSSKYHNVGFDNQRKKWIASLKYKGKSNTKRFSTEKEAALYVNYLIDKFDVIHRTKNIII